MGTDSQPKTAADRKDACSTKPSVSSFSKEDEEDTS